MHWREKLGRAVAGHHTSTEIVPVAVGTNQTAAAEPVFLPAPDDESAIVEVQEACQKIIDGMKTLRGVRNRGYDFEFMILRDDPQYTDSVRWPDKVRIGDLTRRITVPKKRITNKLLEKPKASHHVEVDN